MVKRKLPERQAKDAVDASAYVGGVTAYGQYARAHAMGCGGRWKTDVDAAAVGTCADLERMECDGVACGLLHWAGRFWTYGWCFWCDLVLRSRKLLAWSLLGA